MNITAKVMFLLCCLTMLFGISHAAENADRPQVTYTIKTGDNLTAIAKKFKLADYVGIMEENNIENPHKIYAGATLRIPQKVAVAVNTDNAAKSAVLVPGVTTPQVKTATSNCAQSATPDQVGIASWYGGKDGYHGKTTASGERYNMQALTAAHPTLPYGTRVCVRNAANGKSAEARINDRGPFKGKRIIDVSKRIAQIIGIEKQGIGMVEVTVLEPSTQHLRHNADASLLLRKAAVATQLGADSIDRVVTENVAMPPGPTPGNVETHALRVYKQFAGVAGMMAKAFPGDKSLDDIKRGLEDIVGAPDGVDVTPLAALIFLYKQGGLSPPETASDGLPANTRNLLPTASVSKLPTTFSDSISSTNPLH